MPAPTAARRQHPEFDDYFTSGGAAATDLAFLRSYYRDVSWVDLRGVDAEVRVRAAIAHRAFAQQRGTLAFAARVTVDAPDLGAVETVSDDHSFLIDSISAELARRQIPVELLIHPIFGVTPGLPGESWIRLEIVPPSSPDDRDVLAAAVTAVLADVHAAAADHQPMVQRARELSGSLDAGEERRLLEWAADDNFVFLGYRTQPTKQVIRQRPGVEAAGLGLFRPGSTNNVLLAGSAPTTSLGLTLRKAQSRSTVHRDAYLDVMEVLQDDGEAHQFVGLFAATMYTEPVRRIPVIDTKAATALHMAGATPSSHAGRALALLLERFPRDELLHAPTEWVAEAIAEVYRLGQRRRPIVFMRSDSRSQYVSCLVYLPRDWYSTEVRVGLQQTLALVFGAARVDFSVTIGDGSLAQVDFTLRPALNPDSPPALEKIRHDLAAITQPWRDSVLEELRHTSPSRSPEQNLAAWADAVPPTYRLTHSPAEAAGDIMAIRALRDQPQAAPTLAVLGLHPGTNTDTRTLRLYSRAPITLSSILPMLQSFGVQVHDESSWQVSEPDGTACWLVDLTITTPAWGEGNGASFTAAFARLADGQTVADGLNRLVLVAGLTWRQVNILRCYVRYARQLDSTLSQPYVEELLGQHPDQVRAIIALFETRFDPDLQLSTLQRRQTGEEQVNALTRTLSGIENGDADRVLRTLMSVVAATQRTNAYQSSEQPAALAVKVDTRLLPMAPTPRPSAEVWVHGVHVEGVHLRFGPVARGGLRWSDRPEDFRTEILGLVKAQSVKNAVIIPAGAKGGFVVRQRREDLNHEEWLACGVGAYATFVGALLDLTDNIPPGQNAGEPVSVLHPSRTVIFDGDDSYLVVAADKGTAQLSDTANSIATARGFWLGNAFASGGSDGYDHKAIGITARGTWESVRRHFRELNLDPERDQITAVGVGDMSGDVFGNGMLLSSSMQLVAAFDHRHIFLDPNPDPAVSHRERRRLFALATSSWADYDTALLSRGGGIFDRTAKAIPVTPEVAKALDLPDTNSPLPPQTLISAILRAPVDLFWNGGVGTYVKASAESQADASDRSNDAVRINGSDVRARVVAEGGNLGFTQRGRIEAAQHGVRINTDAIDNSAGVDCSDHEVNLKILLDAVVSAGELDVKGRSALLRAMSDEVAELVLQDNYDQNLLLGNARATAPLMLPVQARLIKQLVSSAGLDRSLEGLPDEDEITARLRDSKGLTSPELAVVAAYVKLHLKAQLTDSMLSQEPFAATSLAGYFPKAVRQRYREAVATHPLRKEIVATVLANELVNVGGLTFAYRAVEDTSGNPASVVKAYLVARDVFDVQQLMGEISALDNQVDPALQAGLYLETRRLLDRAVRWFLQRGPADLDVQQLQHTYCAPVQALLGTLPDLLLGDEHHSVAADLRRLLDGGVPARLARRAAALLYEFRLLDIVEIHRRTGRPARDVANVYLGLSNRYGVATMLQRIAELPRTGRWEALGRSNLRIDLEQAISGLTEAVLATNTPATLDGLDQWEAEAGPDFRRGTDALREVGRMSWADFAAITVAIRLFREAVPGTQPKTPQ